MNRMDFVENASLRRDLPPFRVGDTVRVHVRVREGEKERVQVFEGVVIRRRGGSRGETFTVRKVSNGVGVERIFPVQSPSVTRVEIKQRGHVRRSRLYYLRNLRGKKARLQAKVRDLSNLLSDEERDGPLEVAEPEMEAAAVEEETVADSPEAETAPEASEPDVAESDEAAEAEPEAAEPEEAAESEEEPETKG